MIKQPPNYHHKAHKSRDKPNKEEALMVTVVKALEEEGEAPKKARNHARAVNKNSIYQRGCKIKIKMTEVVS